FWRAGYFSWSLFWPFALLAVPMAFLGGYVNLPTQVFKVLVGVVVLFSAARFFWNPADDTVAREPSRPLAISLGAGLGLLSGLTGTGGGIFLTPLLLMMRWAKTKNAAAVSALFILVNSTSGLLGNLTSTRRFPAFAIALAVAAILGGTAGSYFGSRRFDHVLIKRLLAVVLLVAGLKLVFTQ
ncbi:MAG: TSUP family transporter, partial [Luteolibacter sp.]